MPRLGDYIGHLMVELTIARTHADLETVRIAELYANHPLLKHFSVPRFRLPEVTISVPVAITGMEAPANGKTFLNPDRLPAMAKALRDTVDTYFKEKEVRISAAKSTALKTRLATILEEIIKAREVPLNLAHIADKLAEEVITSIHQDTTEKSVDDQRYLQLKLRQNLLPFIQQPPRLRILATTKDLQEFKEPDHLVQLRLTISEESVEWTVIEIEGKDLDRLIPE